jgi:phosphoribosylamine---glycine ligase
MRVLVIGSGGREHTMVWSLRRSRRVREVFCLPGNGGIERDARCLTASVQDHEAVAGLVATHKINLVVVGPEAPLAAGLVDSLAAKGIPVLGPSRAAAMLESSKVFAKEFMLRHGIPTAACTVHTDAQEALSRLGSSEVRFPLVVKADGLAAGKGVIVARGRAEAEAAVHRILVQREFGASGNRLILEDFLAGVEASYIVFTDGETIVPAVAARDHKAVYDNDLGPNTGGMGAYSANGLLAPGLESWILEKIVQPVITGMKKEGTPFRGMLYSGLMLTPDGPQVLEFNVRMGDPEAQVILPRLDSDFAVLCESLCQGRLRDYRPSWSDSAAVCVVLASGGYPGAYEKGKVISGLKMAEEDRRVNVFHSGTSRLGENLVTGGGRVLGVTAVGSDLAEAVIAAYEAVNKIHFEGMHCRRDIGAKGIDAAAREGMA